MHLENTHLIANFRVHHCISIALVWIDVVHLSRYNGWPLPQGCEHRSATVEVVSHHSAEQADSSTRQHVERIELQGRDRGNGNLELLILWNCRGERGIEAMDAFHDDHAPSISIELCRLPMRLVCRH